MEQQTNNTTEPMAEETVMQDSVNENDETTVESSNSDNTNDTVKAMEDKVAELNDKYLRLFAEFDNFKKRTATERIELVKTASKDIMAALLPVLDDFDRAKKASENESSGEVFTEGVTLVYNKLQSVLKNKGLEAMESDGEAFNAEFHEAITEIPAGDAMKGKVIDTVEKGYFLNQKIIRYAKVVVGK